MNTIKQSIRDFSVNNAVVLVIAGICLGGFFLSGLSPAFFLNDIISRLARNTFVVLALIIPVVAGLGLNFAVVLGAMGGQSAIVAATHWNLGGFGGIAAAMLLSLPLNILFGWLTGKLLNRTRGREMIAGLILGFFSLGIYQMVFLLFIGTIIPMDNPAMVLSSGVGLRTSIDIGPLKYGMDHFLLLHLHECAIILGGALAAWSAWRLVREIRRRRAADALAAVQALGRVPLVRRSLELAVGLALVAWGLYILNSASLVRNLQVPVLTFFFIFLLSLFTAFILKTKLGQDFRMVGQDQHVATVSGINVDRVRIVAIILSTVLAGWGQIIFLQNIGIFSTYGAHEQVGLFAVASILIGGASVTRAGVGHALLGTLLFHTLFIISPLAAQTLFGNAQVGEYFRVFIAYGIIGVALAMYAWKKLVQARRAREAAEAAEA